MHACALFVRCDFADMYTCIHGVMRVYITDKHLDFEETGNLVTKVDSLSKFERKVEIKVEIVEDLVTKLSKFLQEAGFTQSGSSAGVVHLLYSIYASYDRALAYAHVCISVCAHTMH